MTSEVVVKQGNIFTSQCQTLVNTVNCDGVMGAGIALEFKLRHPEMFEKYVEHCQNGRIAIGKLWIYKPPANSKEQRWVLNFPTKLHWKNPSKVEYLEFGLEKFVQTYHSRGIESIAFPVLGSMNGGLTEEESLSVMQEYLRECAIPVEVYRYDPQAVDDLYEDFKRKFMRMTDDQLAGSLKLRIDIIRKIREAMDWEQRINSISQLASVKGIGSKSLEKSFRFIMDSPDQEGIDAPLLWGVRP